MDAVKLHYERNELVENIKKALEEAGLADKELTVQELATLDHFHTRGLEATKDVAEFLRVSPDSKILDIGSGLGGPARYFAKKFGAGVTGIDLTPSYVEAAEYLTARSGLSELVKFDCGDALALPYKDENFDIVMTQHVAMNVQNRKGFYSEAYRVLKAGGQLTLYDVIAGDKGDVLYPVPWADGPDTSFLLTEQALKQILIDQKFQILHWLDRTNAVIDWFAEFSKKRSAAGVDQILGLHLIVGSDFGTRAFNLAKSLKEGRAKVLQVLVTK